MTLEMAYLTTNPSPFIINVPELQNVQTSATGASGIASLSNTVNDILTYLNTANSQININTIGSATTGSISFTSNINLSNSVITFLGSNLLGSNLVNGPANFLAFQVNSVERARLTTTGFGIGTASPALNLDVNGSARISSNLGIGTASPLLPLDVQGGAIIRGPLYVSTFGATSSQTGNIIADGNVFANGYFTPSDPLLKRDIVAYVSPGLPTPVEFNWRSNGERDIGVLADEIARLEPACVVPSPTGVLNVDYAKLTVLLCAEVRTLKSQMSTMMARLH
jgi:hypothetical protein